MSSNTYFKRVQAATPTRFWINNVTKEQARLAIEAGARSCTQNPSYPWKILSDPTDGPAARKLMDELISQEKDDETVLRELQCRLIAEICKIFQPTFEETHHTDGWVTIQGSPLHEDRETILEWGRRHHATAPNMMLKIPATASGISAIEALIQEGCTVLATEVMSVAQVIDVCETYERAASKMENPPELYFAHIAGIFDEHLQATVEKEGINVDRDALYQAGIIVAKKISRVITDRGYSVKMLSGGARGLHHFTEMVGARASVTINWGGTADKLLELDGPAIDRFSAVPSPDVIDELLEKVPDFARAYNRKGLTADAYESFGPVVRFRTSFENAWNKCLAAIAARRRELEG